MTGARERTSPFDRAVVGVDGGDGGRDAVALAIALGARHLTLAGVYDGGHAEPARSAARRRYQQQLHDDMVRALEATRPHSGAAADVVAIADRSPARALQRLAQERGADLIVLGSARRGPLGRLMLGDVSRAVLHDSPAAVAVAPLHHHTRPARPQTVAVGYDGTPEAQEALRLGHALAAALSGHLEVHVVCEASTLAIAAPAYGDDVEKILAEERDRAHRVLADALADLPPSATGEIHEGGAVSALTTVSEHAGVLVVGSRGWGRARRILLGSTSDRLLHRAACPVIVVPRGAGAATRGSVAATAQRELASDP